MTQRKPVFALVDCNNFFVSCERVFRPDLWNKPVAVLSNNDACIVARSNEVKQMGVPMGAPLFKIDHLMKGKDVTLFSANFRLYGDFSQRVVQILMRAAPSIEVYSVDESFLEISSLPTDDYETWAAELRAQVLQWTGIPVSIGVAHTKNSRQGGFGICQAQCRNGWCARGFDGRNARNAGETHLRAFP